jgi:hypothetical protein
MGGGGEVRCVERLGANDPPHSGTLMKVMMILINFNKNLSNVILVPFQQNTMITQDLQNLLKLSRTPDKREQMFI